MKRRSFITSSAASLACLGLLGGGTVMLNASTPKRKKSTPLRLCFQEGIAVGDSLDAKLDYMESLGVQGLEVGGRGLKNRVPEIRKALSGRDIKLGAICAGFDGFILAEDDQKKAFDTTMREIIEAAGELGSCGVIMVPAFNHQSPCKPHTMDTRKYLCEQLHELGEFALQHHTTVILEPLNRRECFYLRLVPDAAAICRDSQSEGVKCMGDFWHMQEETSDYAAFMAAGTQYLQHVHIASRGRRLTPGEDGEKDDYCDGMRALKEMGYGGFISFECGHEGPLTEVLPKAVKLLRSQWEKA